VRAANAARLRRREIRHVFAAKKKKKYTATALVQASSSCGLLVCLAAIPRKRSLQSHVSADWYFARACCATCAKQTLTASMHTKSARLDAAEDSRTAGLDVVVQEP